MLHIRANQLAHARLGIVAAKRLAPRAVTRNMIKRAAREVFRQSTLPPIDCIVRLTAPVVDRSGPATSKALKEMLRSELQQLLLAAQSSAEAK